MNNDELESVAVDDAMASADDLGAKRERFQLHHVA